ncbi:MAG: hypothetical protein H0V51_11190, partial [Chloroflexi bacterium]|nr:hypothetical protein [Chloroflexota bacterium]
MSRRVDGGDLGRTRDPGNPRRMGLILAAAVGLAVLGGIAFFVAASSRDQAPAVSTAPTPTATPPAAVVVVTATPTAVVAQVVTAAPSAPPPTEVPP